MSRFSFAGASNARLAAAALLVLVCVVAMAPSLDDAGPEMDEGVLVAYPSLVLEGQVPGKDFESFYGPGEPWLVGAAFAVAGESIKVERAIGLLFRIAIVLAIFALLVPWGIAAAWLGGLASLLVALPLGVNALALFDAIALGLVALALLANAIRRGRELRGDHLGPALAVTGGVVAGLALVFRPDLAPAVVLGSLPLLLAAEVPLRKRYGIGAAIGVLPLVLWLALVGPDGLSRLLEDLSASRPGRQLPLPSPTTLEGQALIATGLAIAATLATAWRARRREPRGIWAATLFALGLFALALVPSTVQRADDAHVLPLACVAVAPVPALVLSAWALRRRTITVPRALLLALVAGAGVATAVIAIHAGGPSLRDGILGGGPASHDVRLGDRSFPIADAKTATEITEIVSELDRISETGETVFVGPRDLRRTNYSDTFLYFLLDKLDPASFYTELNPGTANGDDSTLPEELEQGDYAILAARYDDFLEDNASTDFGSAEAAKVIEDRYELVLRRGGYELLRNTGG